jgi:hypothetical protein
MRIYHSYFGIIIFYGALWSSRGMEYHFSYPWMVICHQRRNDDPISQNFCNMRKGYLWKNMAYNVGGIVPDPSDHHFFVVNNDKMVILFIF